MKGTGMARERAKEMGREILQVIKSLNNPLTHNSGESMDTCMHACRKVQASTCSRGRSTAASAAVLVSAPLLL